MRYRKKPIVIEAFLYDGDLQDREGNYYVPQWAVDAFRDGVISYDSLENEPPCSLFINTLEGRMLVNVGDYIIKGITDELYPCKPNIFVATYEPVDEVKNDD